MDEKVLLFDMRKEVEKFFDDSSVPRGRDPKLVLLLGPVCSGKTFVRRRDYSKGYVVVDAAEIFRSLSRGERHQFGTIFGEPLDLLGGFVAYRALKERRDVVTEMIGDRIEEVEAVIDAALALGYEVEVKAVQCGLDEARRRLKRRGPGEVSARDTQAYHHRWITVAASGLATRSQDDRTTPPAA